MAGDRPELHGNVRLAEGRGADLIGLEPAHRGNRADDVDVDRLTLVDAHAGGGVALDVLDILVALAQRELQVADRHVVNQIDEDLLAPRGRRHEPKRRDRRTGLVVGPRQHRGFAREAGATRRDDAGCRTVGEAAGEVENSLGGAGEMEAAALGCGDEGGERFVPDRARLAALRGEMDGRVPAARDADQIAAHATPGRAPRRDGYAVDAAAAMRLLDHRVGDPFDVEPVKAPACVARWT